MDMATRVMRVVSLKQFLFMNRCNQSESARLLGLNRGSFRKYMESDKEYWIEIKPSGEFELINHNRDKAKEY